MRLIITLLFITGIISCHNNNIQKKYKNGKLTEITKEMENGETLKEKYFYNKNGEISLKCIFTNNILSDSIIYANNGAVYQELKFKKGKLYLCREYFLNDDYVVDSLVNGFQVTRMYYNSANKLTKTLFFRRSSNYQFSAICYDKKGKINYSNKETNFINIKKINSKQIRLTPIGLDRTNLISVDSIKVFILNDFDELKVGDNILASIKFNKKEPIILELEDLTKYKFPLKIVVEKYCVYKIFDSIKNESVKIENSISYQLEIKSFEKVPLTTGCVDIY